VQKGKGLVNPKDREPFWEYVAGRARQQSEQAIHRRPLMSDLSNQNPCQGRPGSTLTAPHGRAAEALAPYRRDETDGARLAMAPPPAFMFLHGPRWPISSTALR
jgi:hypothetical protein